MMPFYVSVKEASLKSALERNPIKTEGAKATFDWEEVNSGRRNLNCKLLVEGAGLMSSRNSKEASMNGIPWSEGTMIKTRYRGVGDQIMQAVIGQG